MATQGHNSNLTDAESRALRMDHVRKIHAHMLAELRPAQAKLKELRGLAKADGFKLADLDFAIRALDTDDQTILIDEVRSSYGILQDLGIVDADQADLFADRRPIEDRAYEEGQAAGYLAKARDPQTGGGYAPESGPGQKWLQGYDDAQEKAAKDLQSAMEKKNAAKDDDITEVIKGGVDVNDEDAEWDEAAPDDDPDFDEVEESDADDVAAEDDENAVALNAAE